MVTTMLNDRYCIFTSIEERAGMNDVITEQDKEYEAREKAAAPGD